MSVPPFGIARAVVQRALAEHVFPAAAVEVGCSRGALWSEAFGTIGADDAPRPTPSDAIFDLASLTKVIATTSVTMRQVEEGTLSLDDPVARRLPTWRGLDREHVTVRDLLAHCSGLAAYLPFYRDHEGRTEFEHAIAALPLEYAPGTRSIYSDLGFMLLAWILADAARRPLDQQFDDTCRLLAIEDLRFRPPADWRARTAPTGVDPWRARLLVGEVHDQNAWALAGVAGHAGLFGSAASVGAFAREILGGLRGTSSRLAALATLRTFARRTTVPGSSRAVGWDTMLPTSSCGRRMAPTAIGHTGFTGTSLWIDWETDVYVVLLTNRVHTSVENQAILDVRPAFHDAIMDALSHPAAGA
jgi:CubicO group peptidase (beta-lactamase class C family)